MAASSRKDVGGERIVVEKFYFIFLFRPFSQPLFEDVKTFENTLRSVSCYGLANGYSKGPHETQKALSCTKKPVLKAYRGILAYIEE